jgi:putative endonuclease
MLFKRDPRALDRKDLGEWGEKLATKYLKSKGYQILERNYSCKMGEIDIIVEKGEFLIFIEVKTRRSDSYGLPQAAVNYYKQEKIKKVALYYLGNIEDNDLQIRFDVISIMLKGVKPQIDHFQGAF